MKHFAWLLLLAASVAGAATFTVTNLNDSGAGSLRDALAQADAAPDADTIEFAVTGTIVLTTFPLQVQGAVNIKGPGASLLTIDGNQLNRIFTIVETTNPGCPAPSGPSDYLVTISGMTITGGRRKTDNSGGAIFTLKSLTLDSVVIRDNQAPRGAGVSFLLQHPNQALTVRNSTFEQNIAIPLSALAPNSTVFAGGLMITENCSGTRTQGVTASISGSTFAANQAFAADASGLAGAIYTNADVDMTIVDSRIVGNSVVPPATIVSGAIYAGGGYYGRAKSLRIERSEIADNSASLGGGMRVTNNLATDQTPATAMRVTVVNSTLSGNAAPVSTGGAIEAFGNVAIEIDNSTISANSAPSTGTGGIRLNIGATNPAGATTADPTITLASSIVAGSLGGSVDIGGANLASLPVAAAQSIVGALGSNVTINGIGNLVGVSPQLGPLAFNGGPTRTMAETAVSPGLKVGSNPLGLATDQRGVGYPRTSNGGTDIGAFQSSLTPIPPTPVNDNPIPTLSQYALMLLALLIAGMGVQMIRRRG